MSQFLDIYSFIRYIFAALWVGSIIFSNPVFAIPNKLSDEELIEGAKLCTLYIPRQEKQFDIPNNLLAAIASTESGRYQHDLEINLPWPWPWTIKSDGRQTFFDSKEEAIEAVKGLQANEHKNIDVGCMQINLLQHPNAFASLDQAFDPAYNITYAAQLLRNNFNQQNSWEKATANYRPNTVSYSLLVFEQWKKIIDKVAEARLGKLKEAPSSKAKPQDKPEVTSGITFLIFSLIFIVLTWNKNKKIFINITKFILFHIVQAQKIHNAYTSRLIKELNVTTLKWFLGIFLPFLLLLMRKESTERFIFFSFFGIVLVLAAILILYIISWIFHFFFYVIFGIYNFIKDIIRIIFELIAEKYNENTHKNDNKAREENKSKEDSSYEKNYSQTPPHVEKMTTEKAALILGVSLNATKEMIKTAHNRLIKKMHPDAGGNDYLASQINLARDYLMQFAKY